MVSADLTSLHSSGSEPVIDTNFAAHLFAARNLRSFSQQQLAERSRAHVIQIRRCDAGTSQPALDVLRVLAPALKVSANSPLLGNDERGPILGPKPEAIDQVTPDEEEHIAALPEGPDLRHHAHQALSGQAS